MTGTYEKVSTSCLLILGVLFHAASGLTVRRALLLLNLSMNNFRMSFMYSSISLVATESLGTIAVLYAFRCAVPKIIDDFP
jgi:hypothetical protein